MQFLYLQICLVTLLFSSSKSNITLQENHRIFKLCVYLEQSIWLPYDNDESSGFLYFQYM